MKQRIVITHAEMGIYLGSPLGFGLWSLLDTAGQSVAVTCATADDARDWIEGWDENDNPEAYEFVPVHCAGDYATPAELVAAGLGDRLGDLLENERALEGLGTTIHTGDPSEIVATQQAKTATKH